MKWVLWIAIVLMAVPACAQELRNPDVPFGFMAVDVWGGQSLGAKTEYHSRYSDAVFETDVGHFGVSFMVPAGRRATLILDAGHNRGEMESDGGQMYTSRVTTVNLRLRFYLGG
ncbi:MAG: hypothetical protein KAW17_09195 [Candidatus Eisenbacteria sp.]|nr:hypothetical protein [Candidatus Eisenbacteria bacterium]